MFHRWLLGCVLAGLPAVGSFAQTAPSEYATFISHGKAVSCSVYTAEEPVATLILLRGDGPAEISQSREEARFFAQHGFRVLLPDYFNATPKAEATPANYRRWAEVVEDMVADLRQKPVPISRKIVLAGQGLGASVALIAGSQRLEVQAIAEWSGMLPNQFFSQVKTWPPLLILHGESDEQVPILNARQLVRLCQLKDFVCELQIYAGEGHLFSPTISATADQRVLAFFRSYLH